MSTEQLITDLEHILAGQRARAVEIAAMPAGALLHRPEDGAWNILEVFEHLNLSSGIYVRGLEKVFALRAARHRANPEFRPGWLGDYFTKGLQPQPDGVIKWRMRTMRMFDPGRQQSASHASIERFVDLCDRFLALLTIARTTDLNAMRVASSLGPIIRFKAGDALRFPVAHQRRHFLQIERAVQRAAMDRK